MGSYLKMASGAAAIFVLVISFLILPNDSWDNATIFGVLLLATSVALSLWAPSSLLGWGTTEVGTIASVGISGTVLIIFTLISIATVFTGAVGIERKYVWAVGMAGLAWLIIGLLVSKESIRHLDKSFPDYALKSYSLKEIQNKLELIHARASASFIDDISSVMENLKYSSSDLNDICPQNKSIFEAINDDLCPAVEAGNADVVKTACIKINQIIDERNSFILSNRTKT